MEIYIADNAGFCYGVERAVGMVEKTAEETRNVCTLGPIIHNPQVVQSLSDKGVDVCKDISALDDDSTVVIRSHGVPKQSYNKLDDKKAKVVDATCPFVKKAQKAAQMLSSGGNTVILFGEKEHPEVESIVSFVEGDYHIVSGVDEATALPDIDKCGVLAQTTQSSDVFEKIIDVLRGKCGQLIIEKTICNATYMRQSSAIELAKKVDIMIVIGGKNSANTTRLYNICRELCPETYHIETKDELNIENFASMEAIGITAGASTPGYLIQEVLEYLEEVRKMNGNNQKGDENFMEDFESMLEESFQLPDKGSVIKGVVAQITDNDVLINIGFKTEGVVPKVEFEEDGELKIEAGQEVEVMFLGTAGGGGYIKLSKKALLKEKGWIEVEKALESGEAVKVKIGQAVDKGFTGTYNGIDCFIPENHIDLKSRQKEPKEYVGNEYDAKVLKVNKKQKSFLGSVKLQLIESLDAQKKEFYEGVALEQELEGSVKTIKNYGIFMNFGAVDGFMHKNNMSWGVIKHPSQIVKEGDTLKVKVLAIDSENDKLEVGLKQMSEDPWTMVDDNYPNDKIVEGMVITRKNKGYVLELEPGVDGFIPQEELSWLKNDKSVKLEPKDKVQVMITGVDYDNKKVLTSLRLTTENPWNILKKDSPEGSVVEGTIKSVTEFGLFVDFGSFIDGLVRTKDISWTDEEVNLADNYKEGDKIQTKILRIDPERERISLGVKQLEANPWKELGKQFGQGKVVEVKVTAVTKEGITVELPHGITSFITVDDLDVERIDPESKFKVDDVIKAVVVKSNTRDRNIILSIKKMQIDSEKKEVKEYLKNLEKSSDGDFNLGAILKDKINPGE